MLYTICYMSYAVYYMLYTIYNMITIYYILHYESCSVVYVQYRP